MQIAVLGIDLGKNRCSVAGLDATGRVVLRRRMHRDSVAKLAAELSAYVVAMEACCGAHHLGRVLDGQGHTVRLMSPEYVRPYVKAQKNDERDAVAPTCRSWCCASRSTAKAGRWRGTFCPATPPIPRRSA